MYGIRTLRAICHISFGVKFRHWNYVRVAKHTSSSTSVPHFTKLLEFVNLRAQASEHMTPDNTKKLANHEVQKSYSKPITSFAASASPSTGEPCPLCKTEVHPLFSCMKFKSLPHDSMIATVKENKLCINCLRPRHLSKQCKSLHKCKACQKPHHSLLYADSTVTSTETSSP